MLNDAIHNTFASLENVCCMIMNEHYILLGTASNKGSAAATNQAVPRPYLTNLSLINLQAVINCKVIHLASQVVPIPICQEELLPFLLRSPMQ